MTNLKTDPFFLKYNSNLKEIKDLLEKENISHEEREAYRLFLPHTEIMQQDNWEHTLRAVIKAIKTLYPKEVSSFEKGI